MATSPKPYKIWNSSRTVKKSLVARSLEELIEKGKLKLNVVTSEATVVLEDDGTEVDEDEYFQLLPSNTVFILLNRGERWTHSDAQNTSTSMDEVDYLKAPSQSTRTVEVDGGGGSINQSVVSIATRLKNDIASVITLSNEELQVMVDCDIKTLARLLNNTEEFASALSNACQRYMDDRQSSIEAVEILRLYHKARKNQELSENMQS
ncbi:DNA fragmentation factor subunit alpha-like [Saccoglossus kowalevskii]|uniref:DNAation factor subunit alpha-like n=1 Tax=Saccoglossus kowalevskii TaxID=10224 RepID=A0ABM0GNG7_SACKO|nr:PREDICTED: DNA fragmentation factor subunit alpha-like [Saccoglossus kowalevskii]